MPPFRSLQVRLSLHSRYGVAGSTSFHSRRYILSSLLIHHKQSYSVCMWRHSFSRFSYPGPLTKSTLSSLPLHLTSILWWSQWFLTRACMHSQHTRWTIPAIPCWQAVISGCLTLSVALECTPISKCLNQTHPSHWDQSTFHWPCKSSTYPPSQSLSPIRGLIWCASHL